METTLTLNDLLAQIRSADEDVRTEAWLRAGEVGAPAIRPLAAILAQNGPIVDRRAKELAQLEIQARDEETRQEVAAKQKELRVPMEATRAARKALSKIVRHAGRPGAGEERSAVVAELLKLLSEKQPVSVRREAAVMLSEIAGDEAVGPLAAMLKDPELRDDARRALERIPSGQSLDALQAGLAIVPDDFKINIAQSLRARGVQVPESPDR
jgi:HEAT repeat protein